MNYIREMVVTLDTTKKVYGATSIGFRNGLRELLSLERNAKWQRFESSWILIL